MRLRLVIIRRRFWTTYRFHFQGPGRPRRRSSRNVGNKYQSLPHNTAEGRRSYLHSGGNLKSRKKSLALPEDYMMISIVMYAWKRLLYTRHTALRGEEHCGGTYSSHVIVVMGWGKSTSVTFKINNEIRMFEQAIVFQISSEITWTDPIKDVKSLQKNFSWNLVRSVWFIHTNINL
jgi:hypothetical protein